MKQAFNWSIIKQSLFENIVEYDFQPYKANAFTGVDFDKVLEIFRYTLELKLSNHDSSKGVLEKLMLYTQENYTMPILQELIGNLEPYLKKLFNIINTPYTPKPSKPSAPALGWCFNQLFHKQRISKSKKDEFFASSVNGKIETPTFESKHFEINFLIDGTNFGNALHETYYFRNSDTHNKPYIAYRKKPELINNCILCYLYFITQFYNELIAAIPANELAIKATTTILDLASLCGGSYNSNIANEVKRDNIIQTIENKVSNFDLLFIDGEGGVGKTTILHQLIAKHNNNSFGYFIDGNDKYTYSTLAILRAFCNQLHFFNSGSELDEMTEPKFNMNEDWLKMFFTQSFSKLTNRNNTQTFYFILDALDEIDHDSIREIKENVLDLIPYEKPNIKLILGGKQNKEIIKQGCQFDKIEITLLSNTESERIFGEIITKEQFQELNERVCKNNAALIVFFRELVKKGDLSIENIIDKFSYDLKSIYQYLYDTIEIDEIEKRILAILVFQDEKYQLREIAKILKKGEREVFISIQRIPYIKKNVRGTYEFIFDGFTDFVRTKLGAFKLSIDDMVIDYLLSGIASSDDSESAFSVVRLIEKYNSVGKTEELINFLSGDRWKQLLLRSEKVSIVSRASNVALSAVQNENENKYIPHILKYSILKSSLNELNRTKVWQFEIAANLVMGDYIEAQNLANIAFLKEDRLKMFASIAKAYAVRKESVPSEIMRTIYNLYEEMDATKGFKIIKGSALEIASLLMYSSPKLAFNLIEELSGSLSDNDNAFDWALAQISLSLYSNLKDLVDVSKEDVNSKIYSKIRNPQVKEFADAILFLSENLSVEQILEKINSLESTSQKMFLIRNWIGNNQENEHIAQIINIGLKLVADKSDKYVPKANDYKVFALPLPHINDDKITLELVAKIDEYTNSIETNSGTNDLITIKLLLARAICNFDFEEGEQKLFDIYSQIEEIQDMSTKCNCLAIYVAETTVISRKHVNWNISDYLEAARNGINENIDNILEQTASHFLIVQNIIVNLVKLYPKDAFAICKKLNKSIDRDNAYLESLTSYIEQQLKDIDLDIINLFLDEISDLDIRKIAITEIIERLVAFDSKIDLNISSFYKLFEKVDDLYDNRVKSLLYVKIISILEKQNDDHSDFCQKVKQTWHELETSVYKIELGFELAYSAAFLNNKDLAKEIISNAKNEKEKVLLDSPNSSEIFYSVIELTIRVFSGLIIKKNYYSKDFDDIERLISSLPSEKQQLSLWSTLILKIIPKEENGELARDLIVKYIIPKLSKLKNRNERIDSIIDVIAVLYFHDKKLPYLRELPNQKLKDIAIYRVCKYLFTRCHPNDLCDDKKEGFNIDHSTVESVLELINLAQSDYIIAAIIVDIRQSILSKNTKISSIKKIDIKKEFERIAFSKLPDKKNIKHLGYQLLVMANALSIQTKQDKKEWENILAKVEDIPNLSDRIYMWDSIAELLPSEFADLKTKLIKKAINNAYKLPSFLDTVERLNMIFYTLHRKSVTGLALKSLIHDFIKSINQNPNSPSLRANYRNILDVAHATDPEIAKALVNSFDSEIARLNTGAFLSNHLNLLEFQSTLEKKLSANESEQNLLEGNRKYFRRVIDKRLALLNASKLPGDNKYPKDLIYQIRIASQLSIYESQNAFTYFIERLVMMYENTNESKVLIRKSYLELVEVCNLIKLLSIRNSDKIKSLLDIIPKNDSMLNEDEIIDEEKRNLILSLSRLGKTEEEIALSLNINVDVINRCVKTTNI